MCNVLSSLCPIDKNPRWDEHNNTQMHQTFSQSIIFAAGYKDTNLSNSYTLGFWEAFWLMTSFCSFYTDSYCSQKIQNFYCLQDYKLDHPNLQAWLKHLPHWLVFGSHWFFSVFVFSNVATHRIFFSELVKRRPNYINEKRFLRFNSKINELRY